MTGHPKPHDDAFHVARSRCIDAFAQMEQAIIALLAQSGIDSGPEAFGQKLAQARAIKASPRLSKPRAQQLNILIDQCEAIAAIRNDIVHSRMHVTPVGDDLKACFINSRECLSGSHMARLFTYGGLDKLSFEMVELACQLGEAAKPNPVSALPVAAV